MRLLIFPEREGIAPHFSRNKKSYYLSRKSLFLSSAKSLSDYNFLGVSILFMFDRREFSIFYILTVIAALFLLKNARKATGCYCKKFGIFREFGPENSRKF